MLHCNSPRYYLCSIHVRGIQKYRYALTNSLNHYFCSQPLGHLFGENFQSVTLYNSIILIEKKTNTLWMINIYIVRILRNHVAYSYLLLWQERQPFSCLFSHALCRLILNGRTRITINQPVPIEWADEESCKAGIPIEVFNHWGISH